MSFDFGRIPDPLDERDYQWRSLVMPVAVTLPDSHKVTAMGPVLDQGTTPQCVAFTSAAIKMHEEYREHRRYYSLDTARLYASCKQQDGYPTQPGTTMRTAASILTDEANGGMASMNQLQLDGRLRPLPIEKVFTIASYVRCATLDEIKEALYGDDPVALGMRVDTRWQAPGAGGQLGQPTGHILGGHEVAVCGWDDERQSLLIKNSWGVSYAYFGYAWLPYSHLVEYDDWDAWWLTDQLVGPDA